MDMQVIIIHTEIRGMLPVFSNAYSLKTQYDNFNISGCVLQMKKFLFTKNRRKAPDFSQGDIRRNIT